MSVGIDAEFSSRPTAREATSARQPRRWRQAAHAFITPAFLLLALIGAIVSIRYGPVSLSFREVFSALFGGGTDTASVIVLQLRVPRVLVAMLVGMNLSLSAC